MSDIDAPTILVVDDNPASRYATRRILVGAGFRVLEAATGNEGLELAQKNPSLVILDVNLPDMDGFAVCQHLRRQPQTARIPVIHLSATFVADTDKVRGLEAGADGYLTHPVEPPVLIATVNAFLRTREAEDAMRASEAKFRAIFDQALNGIVLMSRDLILLEVNPAMCRMLGLNREQIVGKHISAFTRAGNENLMLLIAEELEKNGRWSGTLPMLHPDASNIELEWNISTHSVPGLRLAIVNDVTERKLRDAEREDLLARERAARAEAEKANNVKDEFLANLSHELRTPLNAIVGWSQLLMSGKNTPEELKEGITTIYRCAKAQAQLIADLLDVSRIISGKLRMEVQTVLPASIVSAALEGIMPAATAKGVRVQRVLDPAAGPVAGDPSRLQQVMWNLVNNAVKFTPRGGTVRVTLQRIESSVEIVVSDNGQGIRREFLPHLFERFRQQDTGTKRDQSGLGLGLAIVKNLVDLHGGTIAADSEGENKGATFTVRLPIASVGAVASIEPAGPSAAPSPGKTDALPALDSVNLKDVKVLIVDDDSDARTLARRVLREVGANVVTAASATEAIDSLKTFGPHVLVSDIGMPQVDGYDLITQVRSLGHDFQSLPAIALTAFARADDRRQALLSGFQLHLGKPVDPRELVAAIATLVGRTSGKK